MKRSLLAVLLALSVAAAIGPDGIEYRDGGIIRGPRAEKKIALEFSADEFTEGGTTVLDQLVAHHAKASFFLTGRCLRNSLNQALVRRIVNEGNYLGPHSDSHPLLCPWTDSQKTLVTHDFFLDELHRSLAAVESFGIKADAIKYYIPPYEWYNGQIARWSKEANLQVINFTPGTRSTADYTENSASNFVSSRAILDSIENREKKTGLNGYLLLLHLGSGPKRTDKMTDHLGELLDYLQQRGYQFVRVDELLKTS